MRHVVEPCSVFFALIVGFLAQRFSAYSERVLVTDLLTSVIQVHSGGGETAI